MLGLYLVHHFNLVSREILNFDTGGIVFAETCLALMRHPDYCISGLSSVCGESLAE